ncbi:MAG: hypothetical protein ABR499_06295 [Gemmatimonadaceae bacterium]
MTTYDGMHGPNGPADEGADKELDRLVAEMRRSYNAPPAAPLDQMWGRIERERFGPRWTRGARLAVRGARPAWWMGIAAALLVGVGIGRMTSPRATTTGRGDMSRTAQRTPRTADTTSYDRATARYLGQTAALLIALPAEARAGRTDYRFIARAADLLTTTRLLLDSPAAADPKVRALLEDVELVLAQVAQLEAERGRVELELITQALEQRDLLPRLHSAVAGGGEADD